MDYPLFTVPFHHIASDHHFSHANIIKYAGRPFTSVAQMNGELIARWNRAVAPDENIVHLGDLNLGPFEESLALTGMLHGNKFLIPGNHDRISSATNKPAYIEKFRPQYEAYGWTILDEIVETVIAGRRVLLSHFPYRGDSRSDVERYMEHRPVNEGLPLIHGHTHSTDATGPGYPRQFHAGVDANNFTPVPISTVEGWLDTVASRFPERFRTRHNQPHHQLNDRT